MDEHKNKVNIQEVIPLVEMKPVLWDHRLELFKHKNATLAAWDEICLEYNKEYANFSEAERNSYRGVVIRKWRNVKDSWRKNLVKTIRGEIGHKTYVYDKELLFLKQGMKIKQTKKKTKSQTKTDNLSGEEVSRQSEFEIKSELMNMDFDSMVETNEYINESEIQYKTDNESIEEKPEFDEIDNIPATYKDKVKTGYRDKQEVFNEMPSFTFSQQSTISNRAESEISQLIDSREQEDRHVSFIKGVLPSLRNFNERQVLKFQMGVLQLIQSIQENS